MFLREFVPVLFLALVIVLISLRSLRGIKFEIWQAMVIGSFIVILSGGISLQEAFRAIDFDVILFLFSMFVIGSALEESGYLQKLSYGILKRVKSFGHLILFFSLLMGFSSAILMNDTVAIIATPVGIYISRICGVDEKFFLLLLAFSVTIGSVMSPIGNPQNFLIAHYGNFGNEFWIFFIYLFAPTVVNLVITPFFLKTLYRIKDFKISFSEMKDFVQGKEFLETERSFEKSQKRLEIVSKLSMTLLIMLIVFRTIAIFLGLDIKFPIHYITFVSALPVLLFGGRTLRVLKNVDWKTLIFFVSMFVLMKSVWETKLFQKLIFQFDLTSHLYLFGAGILLSQLVSNVPLTMLILPSLSREDIFSLLVLAVSSTIAGNLTILGAASNVIIIQASEKRKGEGIRFFEFVKFGFPITLLNSALYYIFMKIFFA